MSEETAPSLVETRVSRQWHPIKLTAARHRCRTSAQRYRKAVTRNKRGG